MGLEYQIEAEKPLHDHLATQLRALEFASEEDDDRIAFRLPANTGPLPDLEIYWELGRVHIVQYGDADLTNRIIGEIIRALVSINEQVTVREV